MVAARRLRKSFIGDYSNNGILSKTNNKKNKQLLSFNILVKVFLCIFLLFSILICKLFFFEDLKTTFIKNIYYDYITDNKKEVILVKIEQQVLANNIEIKKLIPVKIKDSIKNSYYEKIKPFILSFKLTDIFNINKKSEAIQGNSENNKNVLVSSNINNYNNEEGNIGIGGFQPIEVDKKEEKIEDVSAISSVDNEINTLKSKKMKLVNPTEGIITSKYGARDEVFEGVASYHTGIDIGNKLNTPIKSASDGVVKNIVYNDKYYGNYIEIYKDNIIFKYAHLNSINTKINQSVSVGNEIGKMGSTGMSTGSHLHFEIKIDGKTINPEEVFKF